MTSPWQEWKKKNAERQAAGKVRPTDFLNPDTEYADDELTASRYDMCVDCEFFIHVTKQCAKCGCFMNLKTKLLHAECPIGKW